MTEDELSPETEEQVRRLLASARHTDPMPETVAARMDEVLRGLSDERREDSLTAPEAAETVKHSPPVSLDAVRRRHHRRFALLAGAATLVVGGVVTPMLLHLGEVTGESSTAADRATGGSVDSDSGLESAPDKPERTDKARGVSPARSSPSDSLAAATLRSEHFRRDVAALTKAPKAYLAERDQTTTDGAAHRAIAGCPDNPDLGRGRALRVTYDDEPGMLVYRRPTGTGQRVDLFLCGSSSPTRSVTLPR
ncbi:MAG: hypothetical protein QM714_13535 [Nocardioides sp.]|uniref:hypothetical protein n=1 Tax=Nocardioides sp. TaxID=35761 RepID=UPI0039E37270